MKYKSAASFRQALEARLRQQALSRGEPLTRLRKMVAFDRFLARLAKQDAGLWIVKGGFALQLRLGAIARTTKDIHTAFARKAGTEDAVAHLRRAAALGLGDWFEFEVGQPARVATGAPQGGARLPVRCLLDGRSFESFHLDLGIGDVIVGAPERVSVPTLLAFAGIPATRVLCSPLPTQIAEKFHAYTRPYAGGTSSRVRDLVDILLIASLGSLPHATLSKSLDKTFRARATHAIPKGVPRPPGTWEAPYRKLAREMHLRWAGIEEAAHAMEKFLGPVLQRASPRTWDPVSWSWKVEGKRERRRT